MPNTSDMDAHQRARDALRDMGFDVWHGSEPGVYRVSHAGVNRSVKLRAIDLPVLHEIMSKLNNQNN